MKRINTSLVAAAIALGAASFFGSAPAQARPAIVERLAELNTRGTEKDHGGLAFSSRSISTMPDKPEGVWTASGDGFGSSVEGESLGRPAIVQRLAEINAAGTEKDHGGLSFSSRTLR